MQGDPFFSTTGGQEKRVHLHLSLVANLVFHLLYLLGFKGCCCSNKLAHFSYDCLHTKMTAARRWEHQLWSNEYLVGATYFSIAIVYIDGCEVWQHSLLAKASWESQPVYVVMFRQETNFPAKFAKQSRKARRLMELHMSNCWKQSWQDTCPDPNSNSPFLGFFIWYSSSNVWEHSKSRSGSWFFFFPASSQ